MDATAIAMEEFNFPRNLWKAVHRIVEFIYIYVVIVSDSRGIYHSFSEH